MPQLTVRLPQDMDRALADAARRLQRKRSEIVRLALHRFLDLDQGEKPAQRVRSLLGSLETGVPDLATNHRQYVLEALRRER